MSKPTKAKSKTSSSGALRLQAYRRRLREGDLVRTEIVLPKTVRDVAQGIADSEGVGYLETVSALAQLGLETYQQQTSAKASCYSPAETGHALRGLSLASAAPSPVSALAASMAFSANVQSAQLVSNKAMANPGLTSPLARFLKARKEGQ
jgi:hypothetical protein